MTTDGLRIVPAPWESHRDALRAIREVVFIEEQGVPREIEWDDADPLCYHVLAERGGVNVGCGRINPEGKIGRMAVLAQERGKGTGAAILQALVAHARSAAFPRTYLHAQQHAEPFYRRNGFYQRGEVFEEAGIVHVAMELSPDPGREHSGIDYPQPFAELACALAGQARRHLCIMHPTLDAAVFDREPFCDAVSALARSTRQASIRILIQDSRPLVTRGHRLLHLARRLDSAMTIQRLSDHPELSDDALVIQDRTGLLLLPAAGKSGAIYRPDDAASTQQQLDRFEQLWQSSRPDPELRQLRL